MQTELEPGLAVPRQQLREGLSRPVVSRGRTRGNALRAKRLSGLAMLGLIAWSLSPSVSIADERNAPRETGPGLRVFPDQTVGKILIIGPDTAQLQMMLAVRHRVPPNKRATHDREMWRDFDRNQRQILESAERQLPAASLPQLRDRMAAQREAMERLNSVNEAQNKIVARFQSTFDASLAARERQRVLASVSAEWHQAERELGARFDALMMVAIARPDANGEQGVATWIALLGTRAQRYAQAHESMAALLPQADPRERLTQLYGDRAELGILATQLMDLARAELAATQEYVAAYSDIHAQLMEGFGYAIPFDNTNALLQATVLDSGTVNRVLVVAIVVGVAFVTIAAFVVIRRMKRRQVASSDDSTIAADRDEGHNTPAAQAADEVDSIATAFQQITDRLDDVTLTVNYLGDIISSLSIGLLVIDESGRVRMANPAFRTMAGLAPESGGEDRLIGMQMTALFEQEDRSRRRLPVVRGTGIETRLISQGGNALPVMLVSTPLPESDPIKGTVCATIDLSERKLAEEHVRAGRERIESLVQHLHEIQELERSRIARDLHDDLGAVLTALRNGLARLCSLVGAEAGAAANDLVELADKANVSVDRVIKNLWPQMLDHFGLGGALEALGAEFENTHGIVTTCSVDTGQTRFDRRVELALYRTAQEALTNIAKHAHARSAHMLLENSGFETVLEISDDGHGFVKRNREDREGGYGLLGMRQRIAAVSGEITVETGVKGSKITAKVPLTSDQFEATTAEFPDIPEGRTNDQSSTG